MTIVAIRKYDCKKCCPNKTEPVDYIQEAINESEKQMKTNSVVSKYIDESFMPASRKRFSNVD